LAKTFRKTIRAGMRIPNIHGLKKKNPSINRGLKVVAGAGIEPATQGFSVLELRVQNFSLKSTFVQ